MSTISNRPVHANYEMNPKTEDLISGSDLKDGMVVLIEGKSSRSYAKTKPSSSDQWDYARFMETRYWCTVTDLHFVEMPENQGTLVKFIGIYANGVKRGRTFNTAYYWIVKKDSL